MRKNITIYLSTGAIYYEVGISLCTQIIVKILFNVTVHIRIHFSDGTTKDYYQYPGNYFDASVFDSDALAFITAVGTLTFDQKIIINKLVTDLKKANIWSKFKAIYPFIGGTASAHKFNLVNPSDTDAAFRLTFYGVITHSATGAKGDGSTGYFDTHLIDSISFAPSSISFFSYLYNVTNISNTADLGNINVFPHSYFNSLSNASPHGFVASVQSSTNIASTNLYNNGFYGVTRLISSSFYKIFNNTNIFISSVYVSQSTLSFIGMKYIYNIYNSREHRFDCFAAGLSIPECLVLYNIIQSYQTALNRQV